ncbi:MAG: response regulator [Streptomycetaceae bacterium]|nr:MAG: response regulator [Streptomycetaceae bacterium]
MAAETLILAIDDDLDILKLIRFMLTKEGYSVITADGGAEGLRLAKELNPDLILLDVSMPAVSGLDVLQAVRSDKDSKTNTIPILMLTAQVATEDIDEALSLGANAYMVKPFRPSNLLAKIPTLLKK